MSKWPGLGSSWAVGL